MLTEFPETLCRFFFSIYYYFVCFFNFFLTSQIKIIKKVSQKKFFEDLFQDFLEKLQIIIE